MLPRGDGTNFIVGCPGSEPGVIYVMVNWLCCVIGNQSFFWCPYCEMFGKIEVWKRICTRFYFIADVLL